MSKKILSLSFRSVYLFFERGCLPPFRESLGQLFWSFPPFLGRIYCWFCKQLIWDVEQSTLLGQNLLVEFFLIQLHSIMLTKWKLDCFTNETILVWSIKNIPKIYFFEIILRFLNGHVWHLTWLSKAIYQCICSLHMYLTSVPTNQVPKIAKTSVVGSVGKTFNSTLQTSLTLKNIQLTTFTLNLSLQTVLPFYSLCLILKIQIVKLGIISNQNSSFLLRKMSKE